MRTSETAADSRSAGGPSLATPQPLDAGSLRRILVVRPDNIGDVVMAGPALRAIRRAAPRARITLLASPAGAQAVPLLPWVSSAMVERVSWQALPPAPAVDADAERRLVERVQAGRFDAALILTSFSQTPWPAAHLCLMAGIPVRAGQAADFGGAVLTHRVAPAPDGAHQVDRNLHLLAGLGLAITPADRALEVDIPKAARLEAQALLASVGITPGRPYLVLAPGASAAARRFPADRFATVASRLRRRLPGIGLVLAGTARDGHTLARTLEVAGVRSLVDRTTVPGLAALIAGARVVVTAHSAPMHLADATRRPSVVLFSGTDRRSEWAPRSAPSAVLGHEPACAPCRAFTCPFGLECLDIDPDEVVEAVAGLADGILPREEPWPAIAS